MDERAPRSPAETRRDPNVLISLVASIAAAMIALTAPDVDAVSAPAGTLLAFLALTLVLQLVSVEVYGRGAFSFGGAGLLALGFIFSVGAAMAVAALIGLVVLVARRGRLNRGVFDAAQFSLSAGAGAARLSRLRRGQLDASGTTPPALAAGAAYMLVNVGLLTLRSASPRATKPARDLERALPLADALLPLRRAARARPHRRLRQGRPHRPAGLHATAGGDDVLGPAVRQQDAQVGRGGARGERGAAGSNTQLGAQRRPPDPLPVRRRPRRARARPHVARGLRRGGALTADRRPHGSRSATATAASPSRPAGADRRLALAQAPGFESERWERLREAILPQLATALESADLVEEVRKKPHRDDRRARAQHGGEGLLHRRPYRAVSEVAVALAGASRLLAAPSSTRSRSAPSCTTSARSASPSASSTSRARSTTTSGW